MKISTRSLFKASLLTITFAFTLSAQPAQAHYHGYWHHNGGYIAVNTGHPWHHDYHDHVYIYGGGDPYYYGNPYGYGSYYDSYNYAPYYLPEPGLNLNLNLGN